MIGRAGMILTLIGMAVVVVSLSWVSWRLLTAISSPIERTPIDFTDLKRTGKPNDYLVCPPDFCGSVPDGASPVFDLPVEELLQEWEAVVFKQPRTKKIGASGVLQFDYEQRSRFLGFPDTITVRFYSLENQRSTLSIYSQSHYGYWDLGVNRNRVEDWLGKLERRPAATTRTIQTDR